MRKFQKYYSLNNINILHDQYKFEVIKEYRGSMPTANHLAMLSDSVREEEDKEEGEPEPVGGREAIA